jgi:hypothetical protein
VVVWQDVVCGGVLQCVVPYVVQCVAVCAAVWQDFACLCGGVLQCVAVCAAVWQDVACLCGSVWCSVLLVGLVGGRCGTCRDSTQHQVRTALVNV